MDQFAMHISNLAKSHCGNIKSFCMQTFFPDSFGYQIGSSVESFHGNKCWKVLGTNSANEVQNCPRIKQMIANWAAYAKTWSSDGHSLPGHPPSSTLVILRARSNGGAEWWANITIQSHLQSLLETLALKHESAQRLHNLIYVQSTATTTTNFDEFYY